ncbi:related to threonine dehydrogenase and related Zn-dependent dehydrogenases [Phialocephala subalpina]|uniref:Related to threonine dehydrogenase and related Zn-dependent dehydrogenases n=1 Tax=Phialocephala subalpina TaxID=576137 RepID=A0A1L7WFZ8_9HELO|nr:related to threonine dehydrogenase and related Zn-dependent dehydrogenases [Phialocephala subalpina]
MMRAARFHDKLDIRIEEIPIPIPKDDEVLIEVEWCGLCPAIIPRKENPHIVTKETLPLTMGHEFCGRVVKMSENSKLKKGDAVMVDPRFYCSTCFRCETGNSNACLKWGFRGLSGGGGGLSEFVAVPESFCHVLPESVDLASAALIEPLAVAYHAVRKTGISDPEWKEKNVLVLGGGPIGLFVVVVLKMKGVKSVFVSEPTEKRRGVCGELADLVMDPMKENVGEKCRELTDGRGVDVVFDCTGVAPALKDGMDAVRYGGLYMNVAGWITPFVVPFVHFMTKEMEIKSSMAYNDEDFRETVKAFSEGAFSGIEKFVTSRVLLEDVVEKGLEELVRNKDHHVKILITPKREYIT